MSSDTLTGTERAILLALMAEAAEVTNPDLEARYGPGVTLTGSARRKLNELKLVESTKRGRGFVHELTENGWARCREELATPWSSNLRGAAFGALYAVIGGINRYLEQDGLSPADIFRPRADAAAAGDTAPAAPAAPPAPAPGPVDLEGRIRAAYRQLTRRPGAWVGLARLRPLLGGAGPADVDPVLRSMNGTAGASLLPEENQKTLTSADRAAAVTIGGRDYHLLAIEDA